MSSDQHSTSEHSLTKEMLLQLLDMPEVQSELTQVIAEVLREELKVIKNQVNEAISPITSILDYSDLLKALRNSFPNFELTEWQHYDDTGSIYGFPSALKVSIITNGKCVFICHIQHEVDVHHIVILLRIGKLYRSLNPDASLGCCIFTRKLAPQVLDIATKFKFKVVVEDRWLNSASHNSQTLLDH